MLLPILWRVREVRRLTSSLRRCCTCRCLSRAERRAVLLNPASTLCTPADLSLGTSIAHASVAHWSPCGMSAEPNQSVHSRAGSPRCRSRSQRACGFVPGSMHFILCSDPDHSTIIVAMDMGCRAPCVTGLSSRHGLAPHRPRRDHAVAVLGTTVRSLKERRWFCCGAVDRGSSGRASVSQLFAKLCLRPVPLPVPHLLRPNCCIRASMIVSPHHLSIPGSHPSPNALIPSHIRCGRYAAGAIRGNLAGNIPSSRRNRISAGTRPASGPPPEPHTMTDMQRASG